MFTVFVCFWGSRASCSPQMGSQLGRRCQVAQPPYTACHTGPLAPLPPRVTLAPAWLCLATTTPRDHSEASLEGVWLVEQLVVLTISLLVTGRSLFLVEGMPDSSHEQVSYCFVVFLDPGKGRPTPWGVRRGFFVTALHPSVRLAGAPTSELPVVLLSSCNKKQCPPHWLGSRPILQRSLAAAPDSAAAVTATAAIPSARATPHTLTLFLMVESCGST